MKFWTTAQERKERIRRAKSWLGIISGKIGFDPSNEQESERAIGHPRPPAQYRTPHRFRRLAEVAAKQEEELRALIRELGMDGAVKWVPCEQHWHEREYDLDGHLIWHHPRYHVPVDKVSGHMLTKDDLRVMALERGL